MQFKMTEFPISATEFDKDTNWKMELVSSNCFKFFDLW